MPFPPSPFMAAALAEARAAASRGEVPVGAVVVDPAGRIVAAAGTAPASSPTQPRTPKSLRWRAAAAAAGSERLTGHDLYVTLEPCAMCGGAISLARIARLFYGAADPKSGGVDHGARVFAHPTCHHAPAVFGGIGESAAAALLTEFFAGRR